MISITLVDLHGSLIEAAQKIGWDDITLRGWTDIRNIDVMPGMAFVSPANSLGFMDGGIDYVLSRIMFPNIESKVKEAFASKRFKTLLGRPYLPIGKAVTVQTQHPDVFLIAAPTMWLPQDVRGTHNAYHAMYAILEEASKQPNINHIVLCGLCTGCGMMDAITAIQQMHQAHLDFKSKLPPKYDANQIVEEQPCVYMNTEFKSMYASNVKHV